MNYTEEIYSSICHSPTKGIIIVADQEGRIVQWNSGACTAFGYSENEIIGKPLTVIMPDRSHNGHHAGISKAVSSGSLKHQNRSLEVTGLKKSGAEFPLELALSRWESGGKTYFSAIMLDITERKSFEKQLILHQKAVSVSQDMIALFDLNFVYWVANDSYLKAFASTGETAIGKTVSEVIGKELFETTVRPNAEKCFKGETVTFEGWFDLSKLGERYMKIRYSPIYEDDRIIGLAVNASDRSALAESNKHLASHNKFLTTVIDSLSHPFYVIDAEDYSIKMANAVSGLKVGDHCYEMTHKRSAPCDSLEHPCPLTMVRQTGKPAVIEHVHFNADGSPRNVEVHGAPIFDDDGKLIQMIEYSMDITERKQQESNLRNNEELLQEAQKIAHLGHYSFNIVEDHWTCSPELDHIFGIDEQYSRNMRTWFRLIHPDSRRSVFNYFRQHVLRDHRAFDREYKILIASGEVKWVHTIGTLECDKDNKPLRMFGVVQNITEQKRTQLAFQASQEQFSKSFYLHPTPMQLMNIRTGQRIDQNESCIELFGADRTEFSKGNLFHDGLWADPEAQRKALAALKKEGTIKNYPLNIRTEEGELRHLLVTAAMLDTEEGDIAITAYVDITTQKLAEEELMQANRIIEEMTSIVLLTDKDGNVMYASPAVERNIGFKQQEVLKDKWWKATFPDAKQGLAQQKRIAAFAQTPDKEMPKPHVRQVLCKNGSLKWYEWYSSKDTHGNVIGTGHDVTKRMESERQMRRYAMAMEQSPASVIITDIEGNIEYVNPQCEKVTGYSSAEALGKNPRVLKSGHTTDKEYKELWDTITSGKIWHGEFYNKKKDGSLFWERASIGPVLDDKGKITSFLAVKENITKLKEAEQKLRETLLNQEETIKKRTSELDTATRQLKESHKDLLSSMEYARHIQEASIPSDKELGRAFRKVFTIRRPKDIVSGDFYWLHVGDDELVIALADCTGHGVPGALMSMAGYELLENVVVNRRIRRPDIILEEVDTSILHMLKRKDARFNMNDGMDMSVIHIDLLTNTLSYAGAQSGGIFIQDGEIVLLKPDRIPVGGSLTGRAKEFHRQRFEFTAGDRIYLFSDGIYDQFGGPDGKKWLRKNFTAKLIETASLSMAEQHSALVRLLDEWQGTEPQTDDITLIGLKL